MNRISLSWSADYKTTVAALATFTAGYFLYWFIANSAALRRACDRRYAGERAQAMYILFQRAVGILFLGIPAAVVTIALPEFGFRRFGLTTIDSITTLYWILGISAVIVPLVLSVSRTPGFFQTYPLIREKTWDGFLVLANTGTWVVYILIYEYLFRGFLLGACVEPFGVWPAILVNVAVYVAVHIPYGFFVTLGALPLGIGMCMATVHTGNIWTAYVVHLLVALMNDYVALRANPHTRVRLR